jgi:hypothetical protein
MTHIYHSSRVLPGFFLVIVALLAGLYLVTYSGRIEASDSLRLFDAASSLSRYGDTGHDEALWQHPPQYALDIPAAYPMTHYEASEPLSPVIASFFYAIAERVPGVGQVHAVWLMNVVVTALIGGVFYLLAVQMGYRPVVAVSGALLLGAGTLLWPYSKTLFREPLVALWLLLSAFCLMRWRIAGYSRGIVWGLPALMLMGLAFLTKNSAVMALPGLLILLMPLPDGTRFRRRVLDGLLLVGVMLLIAITFNEAIFTVLADALSPLLSRLRANTAYTRTALHTYLFSLGGSLWGTSPVLLLAVPGMFLWRNQNRRRYLWAVVLLIAGYAGGHALLTGAYWFGGLSWSPRFLVPVIPFVMLAGLPVLEWLLEAGRAWGWRLAAGLLVLLSVIVQLIAAVSYLDVYVSLLPPESNALFEWLPGLNVLAYLRPVLLPQSWGSVGYDVAWLRTDNALLIAGFGLVLLWFGWLLLRLLKEQRVGWRWLPGLLLLVVVMGAGLRWLHDNDRLYDGHREALFEVLSVLETDAENGQPLVLTGGADVTYDRFIMNYLRNDSVRPIVLPFPPGEAVSESEPPRVQSSYPAALLDLHAPRVLDFLVNRHDRLWFLAHNSLFYPWSVRPVERYLSAYYYPLREIRTDAPDVRLWEYSTIEAPNPYLLSLPEQSTDLQFGDVIALQGVTLPEGTHYQPGDVLSVSFFWQALDDIPANYTVAWFVAPDDAPPVASGMNSMPQVGFAPTVIWQPGQVIQDNRALVLPENLTPGVYQIQVVLYESSSGGDARLSLTAGESINETIGVIPFEITVDPL